MAHYAFLNDNNIVTEVITGIDETELIEGLAPETWYGNFRGQVCKRTSYNGNMRKNYAGVNFFYDQGRDAFIPPRTFKSWILDEDTCQWVSPEPYPSDGLFYVWNDNKVEWELADSADENSGLEA